MKIRSHVAAGAIAMALVLGSSMCVYAAPSIEAVPDEGVDNQYEVSTFKDSQVYDEMKEKNPDAVSAIDAVNDNSIKTVEDFAQAILKDTNATAKKSAEKIQERLKGSKFLTKFVDIHVEDNEIASSDYLKKLNVKKSASGKFQVTLRVPALTEDNKDVFVVHFIKDKGEWETITPTSIDYKTKTLVLEFDSFSPASVLAAITVPEEPQQQEEVVEEDDTEENTNSKKSKNHDDDDDDSSSKSSAKSPKTGVADTWVLWIAASAILAGAAKNRF